MQMTHSAHTAALEGQEDQYLLSQVARQERAAFEVLYRRYYRRVFYFVARLVRREDVAEEVVSDVMFAVWKGAATLRRRLERLDLAAGHRVPTGHESNGP